MSESSPPLDHYLSTLGAPGHEAPPSVHLERGAACVQATDLDRLRRMLPALRSKAARITDSTVLPRRLDVLMHFVAETSADSPSPALREAAFALFYFLKGYDLIPDTVPEIGLLDDALMVETVFRRHAPELRAHWVAQGGDWAEGS